MHLCTPAPRAAAANPPPLPARQAHACNNGGSLCHGCRIRVAFKAGLEVAQALLSTWRVGPATPTPKRWPERAGDRGPKRLKLLGCHLLLCQAPVKPRVTRPRVTRPEGRQLEMHQRGGGRHQSRRARTKHNRLRCCPKHMVIALRCASFV